MQGERAKGKARACPLSLWEVILKHYKVGKGCGKESLSGFLNDKVIKPGVWCKPLISALEGRGR